MELKSRLRNSTGAIPASVGVVSEGTLRSEDLLSALSSELEYQLRRQPRRFKRASYRETLMNARAAVREIERGDDLDAQQIASDAIDELESALNDFAPEYGYFGNSEGDGACFGFWISDPRESGFDGPVICDHGWNKATPELPKGYRGEWLEINDHGNMTLYYRDSRGRDHEIWGVV